MNLRVGEGTRLDPFHVDDLQTPIFEPLWPILSRFSRRTAWPNTGDFNALASEWNLPSDFGLSFSDVMDDELGYERRIAERGEIQCRPNSWHDFFNAMTAITFPRTKRAVNRRQMTSRDKERETSQSGRSPELNMLAHFEECGVIVLSASEELTDHLRSFRWQQLFWERRQQVENHMRFIIYGHGLYAKARTPYIGLTGHAVILQCHPRDIDAPLDWIDECTESLIDCREAYRCPRDLAPIPLLGIPGWDEANSNAAFYSNTTYFRPGRRSKVLP